MGKDGQFSAPSQSPINRRTNSIWLPDMPHNRFPRSAYLEEIKTELKGFKLRTVEGLIEHRFPDTVLPFPISNEVVESVVGEMWHLRPLFLIDKDTDLAEDRQRKVTGEKPQKGREYRLANWMNSVAKSLVKHAGATHGKKASDIFRKWCSVTADKAIGGDPSEQKPDCILREKSERSREIEDWMAVRAVCEHTTMEKFPLRTIENAVMRGGVMYRQQPGRRFVTVTVISEYQFIYIHFDRAGVWISPRYNIVDSPALFLRMLAGLVFSELQYIGFDPHVEYVKYRPAFITVSSVRYRVLRVLFIASGIICRGTICYFVTDGENFFVIKEAWIDSRFYNEKYFLIFIRDKARFIENVPMFYGGGKVTIPDPQDPSKSIVDSTANYRPGSHKAHDRSLSRLVEGPLGVTIDHFQSKVELIQALLDVVRAHGELAKIGIMHRDISISNILLQVLPSKALMEEIFKKTGDKEGSSSKTKPTKPRTTRNSSIKAAYSSTSIPSSESSQPPTPSDAATTTPVRRGLLIDYDYATHTDEYLEECFKNHIQVLREKNHHSRTGTIPFMAIEVLKGYSPEMKQGYMHKATHDLESIFYILLWICINFKGPGILQSEKRTVTVFGRTEKSNPTRSWVDNRSYTDLAILKAGQMDMYTSVIEPWISPYFRDMIPLLRTFYRALWPEKMGYSSSHATHDQVISLLHSAITQVSEQTDEDFGPGPRPGPSTGLDPTLGEFGQDIYNHFKEMNLNTPPPASEDSGYTSGRNATSDPQ